MKRTRVVGYVRISPRPEEGVSLRAQRARLGAYAQAMDLELVEVVEDAKLSAKSLKGRPGLDRVLAMLEGGEADGVLVMKLDRLTRSVKDLGLLIERYFAERYLLLSVSDSIDTRSAGGRLVLNVLCSVAQWEREAIGERTREALLQVRREGGRLGAESLGWRRVEAKDAAGRRCLSPVEEEVAVVERIRQMKAEGWTVRAIAATLSAEGVRTKRGGRWHKTQVHRVLVRAA